MGDSNGNKKSRFFSLFKGRAGKEETERADEPLKESSAETVPQEQADSSDLCEIPVSEGALLTLWRAWKNSGAPFLSLRGAERKELPLDEQALLRERERLKVRLEQDAKKRLQALEKAAEMQVELAAECCGYVSKDSMAAWLFLFPPSDASVELQFDCIAAALQAGNINAGIDSAAVTHLFQQKRYFELMPVAFGTLPVQGENGKVIERFPRTTTPEVKVDETGTADYRAVNYVQSIQKGDIICDIIPPVEGKPGLRVDGVPVEPRPVSPEKVPSGGNTTLSEDGLHLLASLDGHLEYTGTQFQVKPVLEVRGDVDYSTGNIDFLGDVHIYGDVRENFSVRATGTITVDGLVEAAAVEAGGDILISSGVLGDNRALLKSHGTIRAKYMENCVAYAGQCVYTDCMIGSQIYSDNTIDVTSGRGTVIGGTLAATYVIKARMIGSQAGRRTEVRLGEYPFIQEELRNSEADLKAIRQESAELEKELTYLQSQQNLEGATEKLAKSRLRRSVLAMKEEQLLKHRAKAQSMVPDLSKCRLQAGVVYPVTTLVIQKAVSRFENVQYNCLAAYDPEREKIKIL